MGGRLYQENTPGAAVFVWWGVHGRPGLLSLYYGGGEDRHCPTLMSFHKKQARTDYRLGD